MKVYQVVESVWSGDDYESPKEKEIKTFLHEKVADKYRDFKNDTSGFHYKAKYSQITYCINTIDVCEDTNFKEPSVSEFLKSKKESSLHDY